jgi:hypothetical protein
MDSTSDACHTIYNIHPFTKMNLFRKMAFNTDVYKWKHETDECRGRALTYIEEISD